LCIHKEYEAAPFTIEASLDEQGYINRKGLLGWYEDVDGRWAIEMIEENGTIIFNDGSEWESNLLKKPIRETETFSVGENLDGQLLDDYWIYRVIKMTPCD
jgi:hypothetical protein|tara:strand:+ start:1781 stop:2083 length:303 start_codon:yes stop_codon:yes gene_type:complete